MVKKNNSLTPGNQIYDVDLTELLRFLLRKKWELLISSIVGLALALALALSLPNQYEAKIVVTPAKQESGGGLGAIAGQFGGLAAMAGLNIGKAGGRTDEAIELLKSWPFMEVFINKYQIKPQIFAAKNWDKKNHQLILNDSIYEESTKKWLKDFGDGKGVEPSSWKAYKALSKKIKITQDAKTNLITIKVEHFSPVLSSLWARLLLEEANRHFQKMDIIEAQNNIEYLRSKIGETSVAEMHNVFYSMIENQTKTLMLAEVSNEYLLKTVVPAMEPEEKSQPQRAVICILGWMLGGGLGLLFYTLGYIIRRT